jgi:hypothetical protein
LRIGLRISLRSIRTISQIALAYFGFIPLGARAQNTAASPATGHSGIAGIVRDSLENAVPSARVFVDGRNLSAVTDDSGRFDLRGLPSGRNGFTIAKLGYAPVSFEASLPPDSVLVLAIHLRRVQVLNKVSVTAARRNTYLARVGFDDRVKLGIGSFLTPNQVDSMANLIATPSQFLRGIRGIDLKCGGTACVPVPRGHAACLLLFIDGAPAGPARLIDSVGLGPASIAAIEVYDRAVAVPIEFQGSPPVKEGSGFSMAAGCGSIVLWTKTRIP